MADWTDLISAVRLSASQQPLTTTEAAKEDIRIELLREELQLAVDNRRLRKRIAISVGVGLAVEILLLFGLVICQGFGRIPRTSSYFYLEHWTFSIFTSSVLLQTFGLARLVVKNLFPEKSDSSATRK